MRDHWLLVPRLAALGALLIVTGGVVAILAPGPGVTLTTPAAPEPLEVTALVAAVLALVVAGVTAWIARPGSVSSLLALWLAAAWLAPELAGSPSVTREARSLGLWLAPLAIPLMVHLPIRTLRADGGRVRWAMVALYATTAIVATGHAATWDTFMTLDCLPVCTRHDNVLMVEADIPLSLAFRDTASWIAGIAGGALASWAVIRLVWRPATAAWPVALPAVFVGLAMVAWAGARLLAPERAAALDPWMVRTELLLSVAIASLGIGVSWTRLREARHAAGVRRLVELLGEGSATPRTLGETIATAVGDPSVVVAYPLDGGDGYIDDQGRAVASPVPGAGRAVTAIERAGTVVALVEHDAGLDPDVLSREIGASARLAVDNERLAAVLLAQVREVQESRERIVAAGDAARRRLERDLHDGAQQRLLAVSYELRMAQAAAGSEPAQRRAAIDGAVDDIDRALAELRELAHGIWPAALAEAGLEAALITLSDGAPIPVALEDVPDERYPATTEAAAYLAVIEALRRAVSVSASRLSVCVERAASSLRVEVRFDGLSRSSPWHRVTDRAGAAGGQASITSDPATGTLLVVELPCA
jgi:signal transduction histidine kinase